MGEVEGGKPAVENRNSSNYLAYKWSTVLAGGTIKRLSAHFSTRNLDVHKVSVRCFLTERLDVDHPEHRFASNVTMDVGAFVLAIRHVSAVL